MDISEDINSVNVLTLEPQKARFCFLPLFFGSNQTLLSFRAIQFA